MLKTLGYYIFFLALILIFGVSGVSDALNTKVVYIASGTVIAISLILAVWLTLTRKAMRDISSDTLAKTKPSAKANIAAQTAKPKTKTKSKRKVKKQK